MAKQRGTITLVFDDGYEKVYTNALPILNQHNIPAVFAIPIDGAKIEQTERRAVKPWQDWLTVRQQGHEIASHTVSHQNLQNLSDNQLEHELKESKEKLSATTLVYPGGAHDNRIAQHASRYYTAARTVRSGFESVPPASPMKLRTYNYSRDNFSLAKANMLALWAWLTNSWLIETYHMIDDTDEQMLHTVTTSDFKKHITFLASLPVKKRTIADVINTSARP